MKYADMPSLKLQLGLQITHVVFDAFFLILLSGDVNFHPGSKRGTDICALCDKACRSNQRAIECEECVKWFHSRCIGMSDNEYFELANNSKASWLCSNCLFPGQDSMSVEDIFCSDHSLNASPTQNLHPKIQLKRGFEIAHLNINRILNKLDV